MAIFNSYFDITRGYTIIYPIKSHWITIIYPIKTPFSIAFCMFTRLAEPQAGRASRSKGHRPGHGGSGPVGDPNWDLREPILERFHGGKRGKSWRFLAKTCWELWNSCCFFWWWFEKKGDLRWLRHEFIAARMDHMWKHIGTASFNATHVASKNFWAGTCHGTNIQRIIATDRQLWRFEQLDG